MADSNEQRPPSPARSTAQQVTRWLMVASLIVAVAITGGWCLARAVPVTASTVLGFGIVTIALWVTVYRLLILGIKRMVRSRVAQTRHNA